MKKRRQKIQRNIDFLPILHILHRISSSPNPGSLHLISLVSSEWNDSKYCDSLVCDKWYFVQSKQRTPTLKFIKLGKCPKNLQNRTIYVNDTKHVNSIEFTILLLKLSLKIDANCRNGSNEREFMIKVNMDNYSVM